MIRVFKDFFFFSDEDDVVPQVVVAILNLPPTSHISLKFTGLKLLAELAEWIENNPSVIGKHYYLVIIVKKII